MNDSSSQENKDRSQISKQVTIAGKPVATLPTYFSGMTAPEVPPIPTISFLKVCGSSAKQVTIAGNPVMTHQMYFSNYVVPKVPPKPVISKFRSFDIDKSGNNNSSNTEPKN